MTPEEIKKKVLEFKWEFWFDRPFGAFLMSIFKGGQTREYMRKVGIDAEWPAILFQLGAWYKSNEVWDIFVKELEVCLERGVTFFDFVRRCEEYRSKALVEIEKLKASPVSVREKLICLYDLLTQMASWTWATHGFEHLYSKILHEEVPKYMAGDVEKNIGDLSFPKKKNAHHYFIEALKIDMPIFKVREKFGWIKARGGFASGFSEEELLIERDRLRKEPKEKDYVYPEIPKELKELADIAQELVYFRTFRTDVLYELMWIARPLLTEIAKSFGLTFDELRDYSALDLLEGKLEKYEYDNFTAISWGKDFALLHEPVLTEEDLGAHEIIKGAIAFKGIARGTVKIVKVAHEIDKVKEGDILVAPTTAPSFIIGMQRAAAFVTDEGGITSHAAIVSREMKKPCIIGTKIATRILKDGDLVEVDANTGNITIVKRA